MPFNESGVQFEMIEPGWHQGTYEHTTIDMRWKLDGGGWLVCVAVPDEASGFDHTVKYFPTRGSAVRWAVKTIDAA